MKEHHKFMDIAYSEACLAFEKDEVPVGAVVVKDGIVISQAHNQRETTNQVTAHAETIAIQEACEKLNTWRLDQCTLYSTMEPCVMCSGVIINSRINTVVLGAKDTRWFSLEKLLKLENAFNHKPNLVFGVMEKECSNLVKKYFKNKR